MVLVWSPCLLPGLPHGQSIHLGLSSQLRSKVKSTLSFHLLTFLSLVGWVEAAGCRAGLLLAGIPPAPHSGKEATAESQGKYSLCLTVNSFPCTWGGSANEESMGSAVPACLWLSQFAPVGSCLLEGRL
jgi:hypothetical protein